MSVFGIGLRASGWSLATLDATGMPLALPVGDGGDVLQRPLLGWAQGQETLDGSAAVAACLRRPGASLRQLRALDDGTHAAALLETAVREAWALAGLHGTAAPLAIAVEAGTLMPEQAFEAAARADLPLRAVIDQTAAMAHALDWWLPVEVDECRVLEVAATGLLRSWSARRRADGGIDRLAAASAPLPVLRALLDGLRDTLAGALGECLDEAPAASAVCELLLGDCLAGSPGACVRHVRGKELRFEIGAAQVDALLRELADAVSIDAGDTGALTLLLCPYLGEELRVRLLDRTLGLALALPRNPQAWLAYGAALAGGSDAAAAPSAALAGALGVHAGGRGAGSGRVVVLLEAGTPLPASVRRSFYARAGAAQMRFEFSQQEAGDERALAQVLVALPSGEDNCEVQLSLHAGAGGDCLYAVCAADGRPLAEGYAGRAALRVAAEQPA
ncbi:MAG: hypothetical protein IT479_06805 [Xanthomonadales bacterium]|nr:hypothetical protein [Xanthomonadales bacterium]